MEILSAGFDRRGLPAVPARAPGPRTVSIILLVCAGYYLGARLGLALTFQPVPVSVLWPCNAILFAAMLLLPANQWWLVAAAALPAHLLSELMGGIPLGMVLCWYLSNVAEALVGASLVRVLHGIRNPFVTPRGVLVFLIASLAATSSSSFLDGAFVLLNRFGTDDFGALWITRFLSNSVADLVVVPVVLSAFLARRHGASRAMRIDEAAILYSSLAAIVVLLFNTHLGIGAPAAQVCLPIPLLLWAALRFGPGVTSGAFAFVSLVTIWGAGHGIGALASIDPLQGARSVQFYLLCMGPTLLFLAAAICEMRAGTASLRLSEQRFRVMLESSRDMIYERDLDSGRLAWSQDGRKHLGYLHEDDLADSEELDEAVHPDDRPRAELARRTALERGDATWECEYRLRRPTGVYAHVHEQGFVVRDAERKPTHLIGALKDVTERLDDEARNQQLARESHRTAMSEFAAIVAHEVRQPMTAILANVEAAQILLASGKTYEAQVAAILESIRSDDLRATEVLSHIRNFAHKGEVAMDPFDMNAVVRTIARVALPAATRFGVDLRVDCRDLPVALGDSVHMQQVVLNLVMNAMDSMRDTPPEMRSVSIATRSTGEGHIEVAVRDRGHGIAPEHHDRLFESFFTTRKEGMGLGLSIARSLVNAHGGRIWAENNPEGGATLRFTIPVEGPAG